MRPVQDHELSINERVRLMRDGAVNNSAALVSGLVGIVLVPIMLKGLGPEAYGLWIAMLAIAGMSAGFDFGLGSSMTREIAGARSPQVSDETAAFVRAAGNAYLAFGILGSVVIAGLGLALSGNLHLSPSSQRIAPYVFALIGVAFCADQVLAFSCATLRGRRRFDVVNLVMMTSAVLRAAGIIALLAAGQGLVAVTGWYALASLLVAGAGLVVLGRIEPRFGLRLLQSDWKLLRAHVPFAFASQLARASIKFVWEMGPVLVGVVLGSVWVAPYYIGAKFPLAAGGITSRVGDVLFPAASEHERSRNLAGTRETLAVGTRWIVVLALPMCLVLGFVGPSLLRAWVGEAQPDTVLVLRLIAAAILADAVGVGAMQVLWGGGAARRLLTVLSGMVVLNLGVSLGLMGPLGIVGVAWGMFVSMTLGSAAFCYQASRLCGVGLSDLARTTFKGLLLPVVACIVATGGVVYWAPKGGWVGVASAVLAGGVAYVVGFHVGGAREEEWVFAREMAALPGSIARSIYRGIQRVLRGAGYSNS